MTFKYYGEWLGNYISQFSQNSEMHFVESCGLAYVQVPQIVSNLIFNSEGDFISQLPALRQLGLNGIGREITIYYYAFFQYPNCTNHE